MYFILDTTLFTDPNVACIFSGPCKRENMSTFALKNVLIKIGNKKEDKCLITTSIKNELMEFVKVNKISTRLLLNITVQDYNPEVKIPAFLMLDYIKDNRQRLNNAEKRGVNDIKKAIKYECKNDSSNKEPGGNLVSNWRKSFRHITREGIVDSEADMSMLFLAYQYKEDSTVISSDKGLLSWAQKLGLKTMDPYIFDTYLNKI